LLGEEPAQVLRSRLTGGLGVRVERCDDVVGYVPDEDIRHVSDDISSPPGL
jgi:hypothetical protein